MFVAALLQSFLALLCAARIETMATPSRIQGRDMRMLSSPCCQAFRALLVLHTARPLTLGIRVVQAARDEIKLLRTVRDSTAAGTHEGREHVVTLYDDFMLHGPNGHHVCMVFEVMGKNLLKVSCLCVTVLAVYCVVWCMVRVGDEGQWQ